MSKPRAPLDYLQLAPEDKPDLPDTLHGKPWEDLDTNPPRMDQDTLARVRRMVKQIKREYTSGTSGCADACLACDEILARLEKL